MVENSTDNAREMLPCPFCGSFDSISERADFGSDYRFCNNCAARGPIVDAESAYEEEDGDVVMEARTAAAWNRRAEVKVQDARIPDHAARAARGRWREAYEALRATAAEAKLAKAVEALRFYGGVMPVSFCPAQDGGSKARATLTEIGERHE